MRRVWRSYLRHGQLVELEGQVITQEGVRRWSGITPNGQPVKGAISVAAIVRERIWVVRVNGRVVDRALTLRRAKQRAECAARAASLTR